MCSDCDRLEGLVEDLVETVEEQQDEIEQLRERVDDVEDDVDKNSEDVDRAHLDLATLRGRVSDVEQLKERLEDGDLADAGETGPSVDTETPLEDVVALPQNIAESELTANQQRARFIASDIRDYASVSGRNNYLLSSSDVRRVLKAAGENHHRETVNRVMEFIDQLGEEFTKLKTKNGEKKLFIERSEGGRLHKLGDLDTHVSVTGEEV